MQLCCIINNYGLTLPSLHVEIDQCKTEQSDEVIVRQAGKRKCQRFLKSKSYTLDRY